VKYWVRWVEKLDSKSGNDPRPIRRGYAAPEWWLEQHRQDGRAVICAIVHAPSPRAARKIIFAHWDPYEFDRPLEVEENWRPDPVRFPARVKEGAK